MAENTRKFRGNPGALLGLLLVFLLMGVAPLWLACEVPTRQSLAALWMERLVFGGMGLGFGWYMGWGLLEWFTVYTVDTDSITRRAWNGTRRMRWSDVTRFEASGHKDGTLTLTDNQRRELPICFSLLNARSNRELRDLIAPPLALLRERQIRDIGSADTIYRPLRSLRIFTGLLTMLLMGGMIAGILAVPFAPAPLWETVVTTSCCAVFLGGIFLLGLWLTLKGFTYALIISSHSLTERSLFGTKQIAFHHVTALSSREVQYKGDTWETTIVEGNGAKITLTSKMRDYPLLLDYLRAHVDAAAIQEGNAQAEAFKRQQQKTQQRILLVCLPLLVVCGVGMGGYILFDANARLTPYRLLDAQGRVTTGTLIGKRETGDKNRPYVLQFAFADTTGQRRESDSPVMYGDYKQARVGDSAGVVYLPTRPSVCSLTHSNGRRSVLFDIGNGVFVLISTLLLPALVVWEARQKRRKTAQHTA